MAQAPTIPTLNAQATQILMDFKNQPTVTQENHDVLLDAINSSPFLIEQFNQAASATEYPLKGLTPLTSANLGGSFNPDNQTITQMHEKAEFVEITSAGMSESHVHDVQITKEAPNYQRG